MQEPTSSLVHPIPEDIVIIEDDADDVAVENMVRSVQMDEDEAYARSLQVRLFWSLSRNNREVTKAGLTLRFLKKSFRIVFVRLYEYDDHVTLWDLSYH